MSPTRRELMRLLAGTAIAAIAPVAMDRQDAGAQDGDPLPDTVSLVGPVFLYDENTGIELNLSTRFTMRDGRLRLAVGRPGNHGAPDVPCLDVQEMTVPELLRVLRAA